MTTKNCKWKVVWITGASTGIGRRLTLDLSARGVRVAASARSVGTLNELAEQSEHIYAYPVDVTDRDAMFSIAALIERELGSIDLVILSAGTWTPLSAAKFDSEVSQQSMDVNYGGVVNGIGAVLPAMLARGGGHIAPVASVAGYRGLPRAVAYGPTKAAIINLCETLNCELARRGIRISVVNPGFVDTPMTQKNDFPMPFMIDVKAASRHIIAGLEKGKFEIAFPWQMVLMLKFARILPYGLFFWFIRTFVAPPRQAS